MRENHWQELLSGVNCKVIVHDVPAFGGPPIDIVITDGRRKLETQASQPTPANIHGVIGIGAELAADVVFADDPTERELQLACDLLYEIVQLRRQREAGKQRQQLLTEMAELDGLTHLANRRAWDAELTRRMKRANDTNSTLCLALFDLDHFKDVNTTHGYAAADKVLQHLGSVLTTGVRADDFVARIGGDEFGVLLSNISAERAEAVVDRIRASIEPALGRSGLVVVTATAGLAVRKQSHDAETLFAAADTNLRQGKSAGRNRTVASI
jgi:diguanylate cyclase (GGDEF)-like protein